MATKKNFAKNSPAHVHLNLERLEERAMLAYTGLPTTEVAISDDVVPPDGGHGDKGNLIAASPLTVDAGDFYYSGDQKISLERFVDQVSVSFENSAVRDAALTALTAVGGPLAGYDVLRHLASDAVVLSSPSEETSPVGDPPVVDVSTLRGFTGVRWAAPMFEVAATGAPLALNNEVVVSLASGVSPDDFFKSEGFTDWRRLRGTPDQFIATLDDLFGPDAVARANQLHVDSRVAWASPNFYSDIRQALVPSDTLFGDQWGLHNTGQTGAQSDADADLVAAWDTTHGSSSVTIAVLDDGVQTDHPDLNIWVNTGEIAGDGIDNDENGWIDDVNGWNFLNQATVPIIRTQLMMMIITEPRLRASQPPPGIRRAFPARRAMQKYCL